MPRDMLLHLVVHGLVRQSDIICSSSGDSERTLGASISLLHVKREEGVPMLVARTVATKENMDGSGRTQHIINVRSAQRRNQNMFTCAMI